MDINRIISDYILVCVERRLSRIERRNNLKLLEYFSNELAKQDDSELHITGSIAEYSINTSDIDYMLPSRSFTVCDGHAVVVAESSESSPGYVRLRVDDMAALPATIVDCLETWRCRRYIGSRRYVEVNERHLAAGASAAHRHGPAVERPALSEIHMKNDNVFCLKAASWPHNAWNHLHRFRSVQVFVVPVSHPSSANPELEWRWSFSLIEREILQNLTAQESACYGIFKSLKSKFFEKSEAVSKLFSSYFIKTGYFWLLQQLEVDNIKPPTVVEYIGKLADLLLSYYRSGVLPSYFVKDYNLIDSLTEGERDEVIQRLFDLRESLPWSLLSISGVGFFVYTRAEMHKLSEISGVDILSGFTEQQFWVRLRDEQRIESVLVEITAFINPTNERTRTSLRNRLRNELQNFIDPMLSDSYAVPKYPDSVRAALTATVDNISDIVDAEYQHCFRCVLQRAIANSYFFEVSTTTEDDDIKERLKRSTEEMYTASFHLVLPDGFDDLELSGRTALSFFRYCCGDREGCIEVLQPCLRQLRSRDDWLDVCACAIVQELSCDHHSSMLREVDEDLCAYVAGLEAGGSAFVSSAALAFYLLIATSADGEDEVKEWMRMLQLLEERLMTVASGGLLFHHLKSSCSELRRNADVKQRRRFQKDQPFRLQRQLKCHIE